MGKLSIIWNNLRQAIKSTFPFISTSVPPPASDPPSLQQSASSSSSSTHFPSLPFKFPRFKLPNSSSPSSSQIPQYLRNAINSVHTRVSAAATSPTWTNLYNRSRRVVGEFVEKHWGSRMPPGGSFDDSGGGTAGGGGAGGFCGCLSGIISRTAGGFDNGPVEIMVVGKENGVGNSTSCLVVTTPPEEINREELDVKFAELVEELDLSLPNKTAMLSLPIEKKWQIYCSRKSESENTSLVSFSPEYYIDRVNNLHPTVDDPTPPLKLYESLRTALRTQPNSFVHRFLELQGLHTLLAILQNNQRSPSHPHVITCVKSLMNNTTGRAHVLAHPTALNTIASTLAGESIKCKVDVLEILGAVCLVPGGHRKVLNSIDSLQQFAGERARFQTIMNDLDRSTGPYRQDVSLKTAIMSFVNAVLSYGPGQKSLEFRVHLRYELLLLGIEPVIQKLRAFENETLDKHIDFFEMVRVEDEKELWRRWGETHVNTKNVDEMFELVKMRLSHSYAYVNLQSILTHLLMLPLNIGGPPPHHWVLIDRLIQQVVLQQKHENDQDDNQQQPTPDHARPTDPDHVVVPEFRVDELVKNLEEEERITATIEKIECLTRENNLIRSNLTSKEQELELKLQQIEDLDNTISRLRERLEKESLMRLEESQRVAELELKVKKIGEDAITQIQQIQAQKQLQLQPPSYVPPPPVLNNNVTAPAASAAPPPPPPQPAALSAPPPPPQPPSSNTTAIPPPPPPLLLSAHTTIPPPPPANHQQPLVVSKPKQIPPASAPLKSFNWSKLPEAKIQGTLWTELDESCVYSTLDLKEIDRLFSAYQKTTGGSSSNGNSVEVVVNGGSSETLVDCGGTINRKSSSSNKRLISVIDGRRAQNCTILLSKLKMSDDEICNAILSMDVSDNLPLDMIDQLLKFTPSNEEVALLEEQGEDVQLARADSFLLKISKIMHYEERLKVLQYKKRFPHIVEELHGRMRTVLDACREVGRSRKLRKMLEVVLALGNYMNRGTRGNAYAFRLPSLTRIADTKSNQRNQNLMNYLALQVETHFGELLDLETELSHVRDASKVSLVELEKDMGYLRTGLECVQREVEFQRGLAKMESGDRFLPSVREFLSSAVCRIQELEDLFADMKGSFNRTVGLFGEEYKEIGEFFYVFEQFLAGFTEAKHENEMVRRKREEEEKRGRDATLRRIEINRRGYSTLDRQTNGTSTAMHKQEGNNAPGEFDDLISALRTGDVFTEDVSKYKRSRSTRNHHHHHHHTRVNSSGSRNELNDSRERIH